ncbi:MAG: slipin family protein [Myxococcota bacterium]
MFQRIKIRPWERGLVFHDGVFRGVVGQAAETETRWLPVWSKTRIDVVDTRGVWLSHEQLEEVAKSDTLGKELLVLDLREEQRAMIWRDGRSFAMLGPGLHVLWQNLADVKVELFELTESVRLEHEKLATLMRAPAADQWLQVTEIEPGHVGLFLVDGRLVEVAQPGPVVTWKFRGRVQIFQVETREQMLELTGQELMTQDKVTLRLNAGVTFRVADPVKAMSTVDNFTQALHRGGQLALRGVIGAVPLDELLTEKEAIAERLLRELAPVAAEFGVQVKRVGLRDVILPGEMKDLMNRVTEAKKAAEAALITRREETAAARAHANTAKLLEQNPTLMRMRELEVLEKVADNANLTVMLGEGNLADRVMKVL